MLPLTSWLGGAVAGTWTVARRATSVAFPPAAVLPEWPPGLVASWPAAPDSSPPPSSQKPPTATSSRTAAATAQGTHPVVRRWCEGPACADASVAGTSSANSGKRGPSSLGGSGGGGGGGVAGSAGPRGTAGRSAVPLRQSSGTRGSTAVLSVTGSVCPVGSSTAEAGWP